MILEIQLTWKDYLSAMRLHMRPAPWIKILAVIAALASAGAYGYIVGTLLKAELTILTMFPVILSFLGLFLWYIVYLPYKADKVYQQQKALQDPFTLEVVEDGLEYASAVASAHLTWDYFLKWKENEKIFLLYHADDLFQVIPKGRIPEQDRKAFRDVLSANVQRAI